MITKTVGTSVLTIASFLCLSLPAISGPVEYPDIPSVEAEKMNVLILSQELNRRIQRLEILVSLDRAFLARNEALKTWRELHTQRVDTEDFSTKESKARKLYFEKRADVERIIRQLDKPKE